MQLREGVTQRGAESAFARTGCERRCSGVRRGLAGRAGCEAGNVQSRRAGEGGGERRCIAAAECMGQIVLWDITTDTNVPAILCALAIGNPVKFCFFGSGASLSASYAVERAILEAVQGYQIQNLYGSSFQHRMTRAVEKMSLYQRCNLDDGYFGYRWGKSVIDFSNIYSPIETLIQTEPKYQIQKIIEILQGLGINSYYRNLLSGEMYVVQVVAPRLERFYLVSHGIPVAPAARGRRVLASLER